MSTTRTTNFALLQEHDEQLLRLGMLAEKYFTDDPNSALLKLRQFAELLAQLVASRVGLYTSPQESQLELLRRLQEERILTSESATLFHEVRRAGNAATHSLTGDHRTALTALKLCHQLTLWYHRTFANPDFTSGPFIPPQPPRDESEELRAEMQTLSKKLAEYESQNAATAERLQATEARLKEATDEQTFWEQLAHETEQEKLSLASRLEEQQNAAAPRSKLIIKRVAPAAGRAAMAVELDEADTRVLIDSQLREAKWEVDSASLTHARGARPAKGVNRAIAEWPTASGPVDYLLFAGLTPVAVVEAKRKAVDVADTVQQAKRYSRGVAITDEMFSPGGPWPSGTEAPYRIPFVFASNGRPFLQQLATKSGIWFCDVRRPENTARALDAWYTPEGLLSLLKRDEEAAHRRLAEEPLEYEFALRAYQKEAIRAVESGIAEGARSLLVAMATGTGKTKTCIALIYRLLKAQRFRRILFLVDRSALGEQAANAFKDTRMENLQTLANIFGIKELGDQTPDSETAVHIATVQGMVRRVLFPADGEAPPPVDEYDCVVVDECHRGYLLDRELSETELSFRSFDEYISKYRRVLDYFDAVKIGLTATPALHTTEIFGRPVYSYSYRSAVIDGYLIDHEPPVQITTKLSKEGITWRTGAEVKVYDPNQTALDLVTLPDALTIDVEGFNRKVITEAFNRTVCAYLAREIDPMSPQKTLIFCATDQHADMVVAILKEELAKVYGEVDDDAVMKITGSVDQPPQAIRRYRNERNPNIAVTVELLTTGIDVPAICNLVFLRRVNSRILYDQMLGRATRLCEEVGKDLFRIYDAVRIYEAVQGMTEMQPVVVDPKITFTQLASELATLPDDEDRGWVREQFVARLRRRKHHLSERSARDFETVVGMPPDAFMTRLMAMSLHEVAEWFTAHPGLGEILDRTSPSRATPMLVSEHADELYSVERGYGNAKKPEDYLSEFAAFIRSNSNSIPALITVLTRPSALTRKELRELALELDRAGFSEANLATAWHQMTNQQIAARIVGYIRQAAIGDPLVPYEQRVDRALQAILAQRPWSTAQQQWLKRIAAQTKANVVVDRAAIDDRDQIFQREGGGFDRLNRMFDGELENVLTMFNEQVWTPAA